MGMGDGKQYSHKLLKEKEISKLDQVKTHTFQNHQMSSPSDCGHNYCHGAQHPSRIHVTGVGCMTWHLLAIPF